jgi:hypothetical protein
VLLMLPLLSGEQDSGASEVRRDAMSKVRKEMKGKRKESVSWVETLVVGQSKEVLSFLFPAMPVQSVTPEQNCASI